MGIEAPVWIVVIAGPLGKARATAPSAEMLGSRGRGGKIRRARPAAPANCADPAGRALVRPGRTA
jgi:hypothetical protein